MKTERAELLAADSRHNRGNYLAGKNGWEDYYSDLPFYYRKNYNFMAYMSDVCKPGDEVLTHRKTATRIS